MLVDEITVAKVTAIFRLAPPTFLKYELDNIGRIFDFVQEFLEKGRN